MRYNECEYCGATLDAGETCDCIGSQAITPEKKNAPLGNTSFEAQKRINTIMVSQNADAVKSVKILKLTLGNFQGIRELELDFGGKSASIYGDNATGKTTVFNAVTWLLFDKASTGAKGFTPKTRGAQGDLHHLEHRAEAVFDISGKTVTLKKVFREVYKKKRGFLHEEFDGHTIDYFVDGVPVKEKEYSSFIADSCGDVQLQMMLTMPDFFSEQLGWEDRRKILLDVCGDCTDEDVIASNDELAALPKRLGKYSIDDYRKIVNAQRKEINSRLQTIPSRIDEALRAMPDTDGLSEADMNKKIDVLRKARKAVEEERTAALSDTGAQSELRKQIAALDAERAEASAAYKQRELEKNSKHNDIIAALTNDLREAKAAQSEIAGNLEAKRSELQAMQKRREELLTLWRNVSAERWDEGDGICPVCNRPFPEDETERLKAEFNRRKSERLQAINEQGKREASAADIQVLSDTISKLSSELSAAQDDVKAKEVLLCEAHVAAPTNIPFEETAECKRIDSEIAALKAQIASGTAQIDVSAYDAKLQSIDELIAMAQEIIAKIRAATQQRARVAELEKEQERLTAEYEDSEQSLYLCDLFVRQKVSMLTQRINSRFKNVRFSLFKEQLNGGIKEECEVLIPSESGNLVPYTFANSAAKINAGLEIINTLSEHFRVYLPVFVDNAESVTHVMRIKSQTLRLVVSENDKVLRTEAEQ